VAICGVALNSNCFKLWLNKYTSDSIEDSILGQLYKIILVRQMHTWTVMKKMFTKVSTPKTNSYPSLTAKKATVKAIQ
jgi:hypothetical protein